MADSRTDYPPVEWTAATLERMYRLWLRLKKPGLPERPVMRLPYAEPGQPLIVRNKILRVPPKEMPRQLQPQAEAPRQDQSSSSKPRQVYDDLPKRQGLVPQPRPKPPWDDVVPPPKPVIVAPPKLKPPRRPKGFYVTKKVTKMFDEGDEQAKIDEFLRTKGATRCPPAFVAPTQTELRGSEEQARLKAVVLPEKMTREEALAASKRVSSKQRQWYEARQAAAMRQTRRNST